MKKAVVALCRSVILMNLPFSIHSRTCSLPRPALRNSIMRFTVLVALAFIASCGIIIGAETDARDDNIDNSNKVVRRLQHAEKDAAALAEAFGQGAEKASKDVPSAMARFKELDVTAMSIEDQATKLEQMLPAKAVNKLAKIEVNVQGLVAGDHEMMARLLTAAAKSVHGTVHKLVNAMVGLLAFIGVIGVIWFLAWLLSKNHHTTPNSTAKTDTTTATSEISE